MAERITTHQLATIIDTQDRVVIEASVADLEFQLTQQLLLAHKGWSTDRDNVITDRPILKVDEAAPLVPEFVKFQMRVVGMLNEDEVRASVLHALAQPRKPLTAEQQQFLRDDFPSIEKSCPKWLDYEHFAWFVMQLIGPEFWQHAIELLRDRQPGKVAALEAAFANIRGIISIEIERESTLLQELLSLYAVEQYLVEKGTKNTDTAVLVLSFPLVQSMLMNSFVVPQSPAELINSLNARFFNTATMWSFFAAVLGKEFLLALNPEQIASTSTLTALHISTMYNRPAKDNAELVRRLRILFPKQSREAASPTTAFRELQQNYGFVLPKPEEVRVCPAQKLTQMIYYALGEYLATTKELDFSVK